MSYDPYDFSGNVDLPIGAHAARAEKRLRPGEYSQDFLHDLKEVGAVETVPSTWNRNVSALPPHVTWVLYDNGELERIKFG